VAAGQTLLAQRILASTNGPQSLTICFEHVQPVEAVQLSCAALDDANDLPVTVYDIRFKRISNRTTAADNRAHQISHQVLPSK
jgi:hypothetical protein